MVKRNTAFSRLKASYLFPEINQRKKQFLEKQPNAKLISLGIGDTTEHLPPTITQGLVEGATRLGTTEGYSGYGPEQGIDELKQKIASHFYQGKIKPEEIFISDGAKCDIGRLQSLFGHQVSIAVQDPAYPVYVDGSLLHGVQDVHYLLCNPENGFFPDLKNTRRTDLIYFCSPNNPTGAVATHEQLEELVAFARKNHSIIIYDTAYANYIKDKSLPRTIYEIEGAQEVAIETSSFSKLAGFTGVRLGWTVVPEALKYQDGQSVRKDWVRVTSTIFNGASIISQRGGIAVLTPNGIKETQEIVHYYQENAKIIKQALESKGLEVFGGVNAPYLWVRFKGRDSWQVFQEILEKAHVVCTPGVGFGQGGESFVRFTAFGHRENILEAVERLKRVF